MMSSVSMPSRSLMREKWRSVAVMLFDLSLLQAVRVCVATYLGIISLCALNELFSLIALNSIRS